MERSKMPDTPGGPQEQTRAFIQKILREKKWTANRLATEAKVSKGTISRALNDSRFVTSTTTLAKIARAANTALPQPASDAPSGLREPEAIYITELTANVPIAMAAPTQGIWQIKNRATELAGYIPGDYVLVESAITPIAGDLVCLQLRDLARDTAETVFRIYDPPYAVMRTADVSLNQKPQLVDQDRVTIWGVVIKLVRTRKNHDE
jgi:transcriptional regulator with XRE-family HTH domain